MIEREGHWRFPDPERERQVAGAMRAVRLSQGIALLWLAAYLDYGSGAKMALIVLGTAMILSAER